MKHTQHSILCTLIPATLRRQLRALVGPRFECGDAVLRPVPLPLNRAPARVQRGGHR